MAKPKKRLPKKPLRPSLPDDAPAWGNFFPSKQREIDALRRIARDAMGMPDSPYPEDRNNPAYNP